MSSADGIATTTPRVRCAIYTRKSNEDGLEREFNSLDAQREACEAYVASQRHEGWVLTPQVYDDGGFSGKDMERPAVKRLLADVEAEKIDMIVVYKVDRLSRSLLDFARLIELLDKHDVSFVSITQHFNTKTSMGRIILNVLLSFAQFEREIIGERIRDKVAAAKRKGKFTGGTPPLGYDVDSEKTALVVNPDEAKLVRHIFKRFIETGSPLTIAEELNKKGITTKSWLTKKGVFHQGRPWNKVHIHRVLHNRTCTGQVVHKDQTYPGEHDAIVSRDLWERAHAVIAANVRNPACHARALSPALLRGVIRCGHCDASMSPVSSRSKGKTYRYYQCGRASKNGHGACPVRTVPAGEIEQAVISQLRAVFRSPEMIAQTSLAAKQLETEELERLQSERHNLKTRLTELKDTVARLTDSDMPDVAASEEMQRVTAELVGAQHGLQDVSADIEALQARTISERDVMEALKKLDPVWEELYPLEQTRIVQLLVEKVIVNPDGLSIRIRSDGLHSLVSELKNTLEDQEERMCKA